LLSKPENNKQSQGNEDIRTLEHCCWERKMVQPLWTTVWWFIQKNEK
jgi:hypothetical protein